jgi:uncharacterized protein (DUF169 family)
MESHNEMGIEIESLLKLENPPVGIKFTDETPVGIAKICEEVPAGCAFWSRAFAQEFYTTKEDHAKCNIGSFTHGFVKGSEISLDACPDINLMVQTKYFSLEDFGGVPRMNRASKYVVYSPLKSAKLVPDVVLFVCNAEQAMLVSEASFPNTKTMGKPTCAAIPFAYNNNGVAISLGCVTNRVRTGLKPGELIVTVPRSSLGSFVAKLREVARANDLVAQAVTAMLQG